MKKYILLLVLIASILFTSCVHRSKRCKKAARNVKKLHLTNW
jgi:hypothetical protein